ncbi:hypothetical protein [Oceanisphaera sp. KMM 10153]|uniref:hypothetical protein n=1 Tax=Oceanisphaera submarina TaxID=3390193 RepID=UPI0039760032
MVTKGAKAPFLMCFFGAVLPRSGAVSVVRPNILATNNDFLPKTLGKHLFDEGFFIFLWREKMARILLILADEYEGTGCVLMLLRGHADSERVFDDVHQDGIIIASSQVITERLKITCDRVSEISLMVYVSQM